MDKELKKKIRAEKKFPDEEMVWLKIDIQNPLNIKYTEVDEHGNIKIAKCVKDLIYFVPVKL